MRKRLKRTQHGFARVYCGAGFPAGGFPFLLRFTQTDVKGVRVTKKVEGFILLGLFITWGGKSAMCFPSGKNKGTRLSIFLSGDPVNVLPKGNTEYRENTTKKDKVKRTFEVEAERVNLPDGTVLTANGNGVSVGTLTLSEREDGLELETSHGDTVPAIQRGDVVTVTDENGSTVVSGQF